MKRILLVVMAVVILLACASCAKKEEAKEEMFTVNIYNRSGVTMLEAGIKDRQTTNAASVDKIEDGAKASLSTVAKRDATTGLPDLALVYKLENGDVVESVLTIGQTTADITVTADGLVQDGAPKD